LAIMYLRAQVVSNRPVHDHITFTSPRPRSPSYRSVNWYVADCIRGFMRRRHKVRTRGPWRFPAEQMESTFKVFQLSRPPHRAGGPHVGWPRLEALAIVHQHLTATGRGVVTPVDQLTASMVWRAAQLDYLRSALYRAHLLAGEALFLAMQDYPQIAAMLRESADHHGITPREPTFHGVVFEGPPDHWHRIWAMEPDGTCLSQSGRTRAEVMGRRTFAGLPGGK
jgi:hypothetical protein